MSETTSGTQEDILLAGLMLELGKAADREEVLRSFCERHPTHAASARELAAINQLLDDQKSGEPTVPARLGEFRILRKIADGGMGEIYQAEQESLDRRLVALKVIRRGYISPNARDRFLREQKVLARLHQTNIVPIHTAGEEAALQYFVMPYINGAALHRILHAVSEDAANLSSRTPTVVELADRITKTDSKERETPTGQPAQPSPISASPKENQRLTLSTEYLRSVAEVMATIAEAVHHAHLAGIIHRDIKPSNIMVGTEGRCWIIDFGLARVLAEGEHPHNPGQVKDGTPETEPITASGVLGTIQYMSPEQFNGRADARADIWGLGATLYELCTLRRAFDGATFAEIHRQILSADPPSPRQLITNLPTDLAAICRKAMQKEPTKRYGSALEFADDLRRWLRHEPTIAHPAWLPRRLWLWSVRNRGWAVALALTGLSFFLGTVMVLWFATVLTRKEREFRREILHQQIQSTLFDVRRDGWFAQSVWNRITEAALMKTKGGNQRLQKLACASLTGFDAKAIPGFKPGKRFEHDASSIAYSPDGKRKLLGGANDEQGRPLTPARLVGDHPINKPHRSAKPGAGSVAFLADGSPLQIVPQDEPASLLVWNVEKNQSVSECTFEGKSKVGHLARNGLNIAVQTISSDGTLTAAGGLVEKNKGVVAVWETATGKRLMQTKPGAVVSALALSPDNSKIAAADVAGQITVWSIADDKPIHSFQASRLTIHCLGAEKVSGTFSTTD